MQGQFGFLIFEGAEELDFAGPWEMATMWHAYASGPPCVMIGEAVRPVRCAKGMVVTPHHDFDSCPQLDYLLVPGGFAAMDVARDPAALAFLQLQAARCRAMLSVCTGAFVLAAAGLLQGRDATTHWKFLDALESLAEVRKVDRRWVKDGPIWTSAGVSAGIDMLLAFIADVAGTEAAAIVQLNAEYFPDPPALEIADRLSGGPAYLPAAKDPTVLQ